MGRRDNAQQPCLSRNRNRIESPADGQRLLGKRKRLRPPVQVRQRGLSAEALGEHHPVVDRLEVSSCLDEQFLGLFGLPQLDAGHRDEIPDPAQSMGRGPEVEQRAAQGDCLRESTVAHHRFEVGESRLTLIGGPSRVRQKEFHRFACALSDVLERRQRGTGAAGLDQVDGRRRDAALADLRETQTGFLPGLFDGARLDRHSGEPSPGGLWDLRIACAGHGHHL